MSWLTTDRGMMAVQGDGPVDRPLGASASAIESALEKCLALTGLSSALVAVERRLRGRPSLYIRARYSTDEQHRQWRLSSGMRWALLSAIESACPVLTKGWRRTHTNGVMTPSVLIAVPMLAGRYARGALAAEGQIAAPYATALQSMQRLANMLSVDTRHTDHATTLPGELIRAASARQDMLLHELRVPLSAAGLLLERLVGRQAIEHFADDTVGFLTAAQLAIHEAQSIVRRFSQLQALNQGDFTISPVPLLVQEIIERAIALLPSSARCLRRAIPDHLPPVAADPLWLTHILTNLLENATTHTPPPHTTDVTAALSADGDKVVVSVKSGAAGIPLGEQEPALYAQQHRASADDLTSKGLGLRIATSLVTAMNGDIWVESEGLRNTTFCVALPVVLPRGRGQATTSQ